MGEKTRLPMDQSGFPVPVFKLIPGSGKKITTSGSSQATAAFVKTGIVMITTTVACYLETGPAPVATALSMRIPANVPVFLNVGVDNKIAVLQTTGAGDFHYCEVE